MKEKLLKIKEALRHAIVTSKTESAVDKYTESVALIDELIATMDSEELVKKVVNVMFEEKYGTDSTVLHDDLKCDETFAQVRAKGIYKTLKNQAQAAINTITGKSDV